METSTKLFHRTLSNLVDCKTCREKKALILIRLQVVIWKHLRAVI